MCLADLTRSNLKGYFANLAKRVEYPTLLKVRDALSSVLRAAVDGEFLIKNPLEGLRLPKDKRPRKQKPVLTPQQFSDLIGAMREPYSTMVYVCVWAGLRASEVIGLKWKNIQPGSITVTERYCRGDWDEPKTDESGKPIAVEAHVIERLEQLKKTTVMVRAGRAVRKYPAVKSFGRDDLVFPSVMKGAPMRDGNILSRHIKPAARALGLEFVNWLVLRRSYATWLLDSGVDVKSAQAQMRHSRASTTLDVYSQTPPTGQRRASGRVSEYAKQRTAEKLVPMTQ
jgi:integrase